MLLRIKYTVNNIFFLPGGSYGESVTQTEGQMTLSEGDPLTVNCSYETTRVPVLLWYVQYPGEGLQILLKAMKANDKGSNKGFEALYNKEATSFHLKKVAVQESDSAVYYCALSDTVTELQGELSTNCEAQQGA